MNSKNSTYVTLPNRMEMMASLLALKSDGDGPFQSSFWPALTSTMERFGPTMEINMFVGRVHLVIGECLEEERINDADAAEINTMFPQIIDALFADPVAASRAKVIQEAWPGEG